MGRSSNSNRRYRHILLSLTLLFTIFTSGCSKDKSVNKPHENDGPHDLPGGTESVVSAAIGDTLRTTNNVILIIGPAALKGDTTVRIVPVQAPAAGGRNIIGARMEPDGLILDSAVVVKLPLPPDWDPNENPLVSEFKGNDPSKAVATVAYARVTGSPGAYFAEVLISHFSGVVCAKNCHAGTIRHVLDQLQARGCNRDSLLAVVRRQYSGVDVPQDDCGERGVETVQAFLDTYFEDVAGFNDGQNVPDTLVQRITGYASEGRHVVLAFKRDVWGQRGGTNHFYPTSALEYSHTAALEVHNGQVQIRNTLATDDTALIRALGGQNVVWYPANKLNDFRRLPQGVAAELQVGGEPNCLSDPSKNPYGIAPYQPIDGVSYWGRAWSDPWTYLLQNQGSWSGIAPRGIPWTAVRIYVERPDGPQARLCGQGGENTFSGSVSIPGRSGSLAPVSILAMMGTYNDLPGYPAIIATEDPNPSLTTLQNYESVFIFFDKDLSAPGSFTLSDEGFDVGDAMILFVTPLYVNQDDGSLTGFTSASGTMTLENYGTAVGGRLKGSFTASLYGEQTIMVNGEPQDVPMTGSASGTFDATITWPPAGWSAPRAAVRLEDIVLNKK